jgi:hypothetical protein
LSTPTRMQTAYVIYVIMLHRKSEWSGNFVRMFRS